MINRKIIVLGLVVLFFVGVTFAATYIGNSYIRVSKLLNSASSLVLDLDAKKIYLTEANIATTNTTNMKVVSMNATNIVAQNISGGIRAPANVVVSQEGSQTVARWFNGTLIASSANDSYAINTAINRSLFYYCDTHYCGWYGGIIHLYPGTYGLDSPIKIPANVWGVVLEGEGQGTILEAAAGVNAIEAGDQIAAPGGRTNYQIDLKVRDLTLHGSCTNQTDCPAGEHIGILMDSDRGVIEGVTARWFNTGIRLRSGAENLITGSTLQYNNRGVEVLTNDAQITETIMSSSGNDGLYIANGGGLQIDKCHIWGNKVGVSIYNSNANWFSDCEIEGNYDQGVIIYASAGYTLDLNKFDGCYFWYNNRLNNSPAFIELMAEPTGVINNTLIQNSVFYLVASRWDTYPVYQWSGNNTVIEGCHYYGFERSPVYS